MKPGYVANVHQWLRRVYGKANRCEAVDCSGKSKFFDYSLITSKRHAYKRKNYRMLCRSCHFKYDYIGGKFETQRKAISRIGKKSGPVNGKVMCKFSESDIRRIKAMYFKYGIYQYNIARHFNCHQSTISLIVTQKTYKHEKSPKPTTEER